MAPGVLVESGSEFSLRFRLGRLGATNTADEIRMLRTFAFTLLVAGATAFSPLGLGRAPLASRAAATSAQPAVVMGDNIRELRTRIASIKNTKKITQAMKLVAAAKVRRAQDAVLRSRPFSENLEKVIGGLIERLKNENLDFPLLQQRETKKVLLVVVSGERGLCGGYNAQIIKKATARLAELEKQGIDVTMLNIGRKANVWFKRRNKKIAKFVTCPAVPTSEFAAEISDTVLNYFLSGEVDRVELVYTSFLSMIASNPSVRTLVPLSPQGLETAGDEIFKLTTKDGKFGVEREKVARAEPKKFEADMLFEQEPSQLLNAILPLYINGQILRTVQESLASELAARMSAMQSATDNASELGKSLTQKMNRARQAAVTQELLEIVAGANAVN